MPDSAVLTVLLLFGEMSNPETDPRSVKMMGCRTRQQRFYLDIQFLLRAVVNFGTSKSYSIEKLSKLPVVLDQRHREWQNRSIISVKSSYYFNDDKSER